MSDGTMPRSDTRILIVDDPQGSLSHCLGPFLSRCHVHVARDAFDAIYEVDCADRPYDLIFCDLAHGAVPGPELWAYLSLSRRDSAERMVFVASAPLSPPAEAFLTQVSNARISLPATAEALDALVNRHALRRPSAWPLRLVGGVASVEREFA
jgi:hypothetical protein